MTLFVFDFDGTLSNSVQFICDTMQAAFIAHHIPVPSHAMIRNIIGITLDEAIYRLMPSLSQNDILSISNHYKKIFRQHRDNNSIEDTLFEGSLDILKLIQSKNHLAGIATGKSLRGLNAELDRHNIRHFFDAYQTSDTHPSKPNPSMLNAVIEQLNANSKNTIMIGDTSYDMQMAKSAGVIAVGVTWGCHDLDTLKQAGADKIIHRFSELQEWI